MVGTVMAMPWISQPQAPGCHPDLGALFRPTNASWQPAVVVVKTKLPGCTRGQRLERTAQTGAATGPAHTSQGRIPLEDSAAINNKVSVSAEEETGPETTGPSAEEVLTDKEITIKAVLDPTWVPTFPKPELAEEQVKKGSKSEKTKPEDERQNAIITLAASMAAQQMLEMEKAQEEHIAALKRAAQSEAKVLKERHKKQLDALEAQVLSARKEVSIASKIAKHFLERDAGTNETTKRGEFSSIVALPWLKPAYLKASRISIQFEGGALKFENMSTEMRDLVTSFNSMLEMKLSKESAYRQAVEERLREARVEHRILKERLEEALVQPTTQSLDESVSTEPPSSDPEGSQAATLSWETGLSEEEGAQSAYVTDLRHKLADTQASLFRERLRAEEGEKAVSDLEAKLQSALRERDALRLESFQKTVTELATAQELLAAQARSNQEITSSLQQLMEEAPVLQAQLAEVRMQLEKERQTTKEEFGQMKRMVIDARAEAAALRVETVRMEEQYLMEIEQLKKA